MTGQGFQSLATEQGARFEDAVEFLLRAQGWEIIERHAQVEGVEIDIVAADPAGTRWWIEAKGSWRGSVPGMRRGDTAKKAVAVAWYLSRLAQRCPYMLVTSHLPTPGTVSARLLDEAVEAGLFDDVLIVGMRGDE